ncbi:MAG: UDP-N-acetylglucosamine 2-epimerase [Paludibacter sp.]|nr:UDP-N-acetylglucosamine 2-epimerase [Paludibacter sp.]
MKKNITILTATRAEYGLFKTIIKALLADGNFDVKIAVTAAHLSPEFGFTVNEIENDGFKIDFKTETLLSADTPSAVSKCMGLTLIAFADYFTQNKPDAFIILGDRYETLAATCAAFNARIPIIHLYGGETTEGAIDEAYRHAITKMSYLHLTSTDEYRNRVIQLGESPERVVEVGAIGVENALNTELLTIEKLENYLGIKLNSTYAFATFHPVTLENNTSIMQLSELLKAISKFPDIQFIFSKSNADSEGRLINKMLDNHCVENKNVSVFSSLGMVAYLSAVKHSKFVIGNSSSGLLEVPSFKIPTINIGDRQKGRLMASSVICCEPNCESISSAINLALNEEFRSRLSETVNPYGDGKTSSKIVNVIKTILNNPIDLKKKFYNLRITT